MEGDRGPKNVNCLATELAVVATPAFPLGAIQSFNVTRLLRDYGLDLVDKTGAARGIYAEASDSIAFRQIIGDDQDLSIVAQSIGGAFDHVVGGFALDGD